MAAVEEALAKAAEVELSREDVQLNREPASEIIETLADALASIENRAVSLGCDDAEFTKNYSESVLRLAPVTTGGLEILDLATSPGIAP